MSKSEVSLGVDGHLGRVLELFKRIESDYRARDFDLEFVMRLETSLKECHSMLAPKTRNWWMTTWSRFRDAAIDDLNAGKTVEMEEVTD